MKKILIIFLSSITLFASTNSTVIAIETSMESESIMAEPAGDYRHSGSYKKDAITGEVTFIPSEPLNQLSNEISGYSPGYNPSGDYILPEISPFVIFGKDNRVPITNPNLYGQYRNTVYIETTNAKGETYRGTGFMVGPNTVATNGHIVYNPSNGGDNWVTSAKIVPARKPGTDWAPYDTAKAIAYECGGNWADYQDANDDWGIIRLDKHIGDKTGWLGLYWQSGSYNGTKVMLNGYPKEVEGKDTWTMYRSDGTITISEARMLKSNDLDASGGNSGGPCYIWDDSYGYTAIGILQGGIGESYTTILRIDQWIYNKLVSFRTSRA